MGRALTLPFRIGMRRAARGRPALVRRAALIGVLTATIVIGGWMWVRDSSLVAVSDVTIRGVSGSNADDVRRALEGAAEEMTTLHLDQGELNRAAASFPNVRAVRAEADFPHGLTISVVERGPVAKIVAGGATALVSGDGRVLTGLRDRSGLPSVRVSHRLTGSVVSGPRIRTVLAVLGAAPPALLRSMTSATWTARGVVLVAESGTRVYFGDAEEVAVKWSSLARVLADTDLANVKSVDVRVADRPSVSGELTPEAAQRERATQISGSEAGGGAGAGASPGPGTGATAAPQVTPGPAQAAPQADAGPVQGPAQTGAVAPSP